MAEKDGSLILKIVDGNGEHLNTRARIELEHRQIEDRHRLNNVDVSKPITIENLFRVPLGIYSILVRLEDGRVASRFFNVRPSGDTKLTLVFGVRQDEDDDLPDTGDTRPIQLTVADLDPVFDPKPLRIYPDFVSLSSPKAPGPPQVTLWQRWEAFLPIEPELPQNHALLGGLPLRIVPNALQFARPEIAARSGFSPRSWSPADWNIFDRFVAVLPKACHGVPSKQSRIEIDVGARTRMGKVSGDCARVYTVSNQGEGCVVNVLTERVEGTFIVQPNPNPTPPYPPEISNPIVSPFTKGGINQKYKRLYVPASFYTEARTPETGGSYVAVVDVDPTSSTYLDTIDWIDCGWIPEEVDFTADNEIGVIANYMQGTATVFDASTGKVLAAEVEGFDGAASRPGGGAWARSVRCGNIPGLGNRAFLTLTSLTGSPGLAVIDLDSEDFPRTNIAVPGGCFGVALTPDRRRALAVNLDSLHVIKIDQPNPTIERSIPLDQTGKRYFGGIEVRPTGNMAFIATGGPDIDPGQGTTLMQVMYLEGTAVESTSGLAEQTWNLDFQSLGVEEKPHIFVTSCSGKLTIIPC